MSETGHASEGVPPGGKLDEELQTLRERIDAVDNALLSALTERARLTQAVGQLKNREGGPVYRPDREARILRRLKARHDGPLSGQALEAIYRAIISECRALERPLSVAYLGPEGTYSELALRKHFGDAVQVVKCSSIDETFRTVEASLADYGVVPIENSSEGAVGRTLDMLAQSPLLISGEVLMPIQHCVMCKSGSMEGVQQVVSHPQSLSQCSEWLERKCPDLLRVAVASNALAMKFSAEDETIAAIGGAHAAEQYGLIVVERNVQDLPDNRTRFVIIGRCGNERSGDDQTSLMASVPDKSGAVYQLIQPFAQEGVSMKRFVSRPARSGDWAYFFHIDVLGHRLDPPVAAALQLVSQRAGFCRILGSYPRASWEG